MTCAASRIQLAVVVVFFLAVLDVGRAPGDSDGPAPRAGGPASGEHEGVGAKSQARLQTGARGARCDAQLLGERRLLGGGVGFGGRGGASFDDASLGGPDLVESRHLGKFYFVVSRPLLVDGTIKKLMFKCKTNHKIY